MSSSTSKQISREAIGLPKIAVVILLGIAVFAFYMIGFDQGDAFGMQVPPDGSGDNPGTNWMHEFYHDMRHGAGFPCH